MTSSFYGAGSAAAQEDQTQWLSFLCSPLSSYLLPLSVHLFPDVSSPASYIFLYVVLLDTFHQGTPYPTT